MLLHRQKLRLTVYARRRAYLQKFFKNDAHSKLRLTERKLLSYFYLISSFKGLGENPLFIAIVAAVGFSLLHFLAEPPTWPNFFYRLSFGVLTGLLFVATDNIWTVVGLHTGLNIVANGISDSSWKIGAVVHLSGYSSELNGWTNFGVLSLATLLFYRYFNLRSPGFIEANEKCFARN